MNIVAVGVLTLGIAQELLLGTLKLTCGEAMATHALHLSVDSAESIDDATLVSRSREHRSIHRGADTDTALRHATTKDGSISLLCDLVETCAHHLRNEAVDKVG